MPVSAKITTITGENWNFKGVDTQYLTHGLHPYPARMVPQIAKRLLKMYCPEGGIVLDPFCGSGTVAVEARLLKVNSIGIDINPLACLLAEVKSTPIKPKVLKKHWKKLKKSIKVDIENLRLNKVDNAIDLPDFLNVNINYWFKPYTIKELGIIRKHLREIKDDLIRKFFSVVFSNTVRIVSGIRKNEFKLYRISKEQWKVYSPDTLKVFIQNVEKSIKKMVDFYRLCRKNVFSKVFLADTRKMFTNDFPLEANELLTQYPPDIVITSPPYGDSKTTVAYGQFSKLSSLWLDYEKGFDKKLILNIDKLSLGGSNNKSAQIIFKKNLETLNSIIELIMKKDEKRALDVVNFFGDLYLCLEKMYYALKENGYCCLVTANRTVRRIKIPTHLIVIEMCIDIGFKKDITMITRNIPVKRLPWKNAPENKPGLKCDTMNTSNILIMKK